MAVIKSKNRKTDRNAYAKIIHEEFKTGPKFMSVPTATDILELVATKKTDQEKSENEKVDLTSMLKLFSKTYVKFVDSTQDWTTGWDHDKKMSQITTKNQLTSILQNYKNLLNAPADKYASLFAERYLAVYNLGLITLAMTQICEAQPCNPFSKIQTKLVSESLKYYLITEPDLASEIRGRSSNETMQRHMSSMLISPFLASFASQRDVVELPAQRHGDLITAIIVERFSALVDQPINLIDFKGKNTVKVLFENERFLQTLFFEFEKTWCSMVETFIESPAIFEQLLAENDEESAEEVDE